MMADCHVPLESDIREIVFQCITEVSVTYESKPKPQVNTRLCQRYEFFNY